MAATNDPLSAAPTSQQALASIVGDVLPLQGAWSDDAYLWLSDHTNRLIEFTDGHIQELPVPTFIHQAILLFLYGLFHEHVTARGGVVMVAALRVRLRAAKFREPDLLLLRDCDDRRAQNRYRTGADLVAEVVSPDNPGRDLVEKRVDYAEAGIPEYWIADPRDETISVLSLWEDAYVEHGVFVRGDTATSPLLEGFAVDVAAVFDAPPANARRADA